MINADYKTIDEYIAGHPKNIQVMLKKIRSTIKKIAPKAVEAISYGIPTFKLDGNLVHFGGYEKHIGFYPGAGAIETFKKEIKKYKWSKGTVQFPIDKPLPLDLIRKIVKFRVEKSLEKSKGKPSSEMHIIYHKDGSIWAKGKMVNGICDGYWEWFRKDGIKMRSGYFKKGIQVGAWVTYDAKGKPHKVTQIKNSLEQNNKFPNISAPALRALANAKIKTYKDLSKYTEKEILQLHGMGPGSIPKLKNALKKAKLSFRK